MEVSISNLNDNINEGFLADMIRKTGAVTEELSIFYHPKSKKHLGLAHVIFDSVKSARVAVEKLHEISVMGRVIQVFLDPFGMCHLFISPYSSCV